MYTHTHTHTVERAAYLLAGFVGRSGIRLQAGQGWKKKPWNEPGLKEKEKKKAKS